MPQRFYSISPSRNAKTKTRDPDARGHSPVRLTVIRNGTYAPSDAARLAPTSPHDLLNPPAQATRELHHELEHPCWTRMPLLPDPFVDDSRHRLRKKLTGVSPSDHQSVSDSHPVVPAPHDDSNQITTNGAAQDTSPLPESQFDELMASYSPHKDTSGGTFISANLKVASTANTPTIQNRFMVASELKVHSYTDEELRSTAPATRDSELAEVQMDPDSGKRLTISNHSFGESELPGTMTRESAAKIIKTKKEFNLKSGNKIRKQSRSDLSRNSGKEIEMRDAENPIVVGESKRKRASTNSQPRHAATSGDSNCSPTRKVSRVGWNGGLDECAGGVMQARLGSLDNVGRW